MERLGIIMPDVEECLSRHRKTLRSSAPFERKDRSTELWLSLTFVPSAKMTLLSSLMVCSWSMVCQFYILELVVHLDVELAEYNQHQQRYEDGSQFGKVEDSAIFFSFLCFFCFEEAVCMQQKFLLLPYRLNQPCPIIF